jgi:chorismate synthase
MIELIQQIKSKGDTIGGVVTCICQKIPVGLGNPVFGKLSAALSNAMMSINATKGFDYGMGFNGIHKNGSEVNDLFCLDKKKNIIAKNNYSGGIQGGISNGEDIYFRVAFKPVATLLKEQFSINKHGEKILLKIKGRHDPCVLPRAVPIVESMAAITILDYLLLNYK